MSVTGTGCRGFWSVDTRYSFLNDPRLQNLVEQGNVDTHVVGHCQQRWRMTTGFICGNIDQRETERLNRRCREKRRVPANTPASSQSCVSQYREGDVVNDRQKPTQLFEHDLAHAFGSADLSLFLRLAAGFCGGLHTLDDSVHGPGGFSASVFFSDPWLVAAPAVT